MLTQSYSEGFYNLLMASLRGNANDPYIPSEDIDKANKLLFLLAKKVEEVKTEDGEKEYQITWYERTSYDLAMQSMYAIKREHEEKMLLEQQLKEAKQRIKELEG